MNPDDFVIVNDFDRPDARHIAQRRADGKFNYVHPELRNLSAYNGMTPENPTPLHQFGIAIAIVDGVLHGERVSSSVVNYRDGRRRYWQGDDQFSFDYQPPKKSKK